VAAVKLHGGKDKQTVSLRSADFKTSDGEALSSWTAVDVLSLRAYHEKAGTLIGSKSWSGRQPKFENLRWQAD
jgi:hypothetical protein